MTSASKIMADLACDPDLKEIWADILGDRKQETEKGESIMKFRVWDKNKGIMLNPPNHRNYIDYYEEFLLSGEGKLIRLKASSLKSASFDEATDNYTLSLSTGVIDKNNIEIYEGDFLAGFGIKNQSIMRVGNIVEFLLAIGAEREMNPKLLDRMEVVGNIYQHEIVNGALKVVQ